MKDSLVSIREDRAQLGLGEEIERTGRIGEKKLSEAAEAARAHVRRARKLSCTSIAVLVTSPGRQAANGRDLVSRLAAATGVSTRVLTAQEEGELAWRGAVAATTNLPATVAVCDVGGGSAQIAVGTGTPLVGALARHRLPAPHPACVSKRSTRRRGLSRARRSILAAEFDELAPPLPLAAIAVGGTARALRKVVGDGLAEETLLLALRRLSKKSSGKIAREYGVDEARARTMTAGALIFLEIHRRLTVPLQVGRGGVREGAALALLAS